MNVAIDHLFYQTFFLLLEANERLTNLERERNLYEMRKVIPEDFDVFGSDDREDIREHWAEGEVEKWKSKYQ